MPKKVLLLVLGAVLVMAVCAACDRVTVTDRSDISDEYATETRLTALEYSLYVSKQITVFTNNLTTRMLAARKGSAGDTELELAKTSLQTMMNAYEETSITYPAEGRDQDRSTLLLAMDTAITHMQDYVDALSSDGEVTGYADLFSEDFNALTGLSALYFE